MQFTSCCVEQFWQTILNILNRSIEWLSESSWQTWQPNVLLQHGACITISQTTLNVSNHHHSIKEIISCKSNNALYRSRNINSYICKLSNYFLLLNKQYITLRWLFWTDFTWHNSTVLELNVEVFIKIHNGVYSRALLIYKFVIPAVKNN